MTRPKILFGMNSMFAAQNLLPDILSLAQRKGFAVVVVAPRDPGTGALPDLGEHVEIRHVAMNREIDLFADFRALWQLWSILRATRPVITDMSTPKMAFLGGVAAWLAGVPYRIYTLRGLRYETTNSWKRSLLMTCERIACRCADKVICISHSVKECVLKDRIAPSHKAVLLGDRGSEGINLSPDGPNASPSTREMRASLGIPDSASIIGFVGRLTRDKGIHELVRCCRNLRQEGRNVHLLLLGKFEAGDPVDSDVEAWIRNDPGVHWLGLVADPSPYYHLMDLFVFPTYREGLPKVVLEAAAAGKPIVSTYTTGVIDIIQDGVTGLLVSPCDAEALTRAAGQLLRDPDLACRLGKAAKALIREHFDNSMYLERLGTMLESLAEQPVAAGQAQPAAVRSK